jgi:hypothetical protein
MKQSAAFLPRAIASKLFGHFEYKIGKSLLFLLDRRG